MAMVDNDNGWQWLLLTMAMVDNDNGWQWQWLTTSAREERISLLDIDPGYSLEISSYTLNNILILEIIPFICLQHRLYILAHSSPRPKDILWLFLIILKLKKKHFPPEWTGQVRCVRSADSSIGGHHLVIGQIGANVVADCLYSSNIYRGKEY